MKLRDLLQIELWSKKTTRKILVGLAAFVGLALAWMAVEQYWLTPGERRAGRQALAQIDGLQNVSRGDERQFQTKDKVAKNLVALAQESVWTTRDNVVAEALSTYLERVEERKKDLDFNEKVARERPQLFQEHPELAQGDQETQNSSRLVMDFYKKILHRALDQ